MCSFSTVGDALTLLIPDLNRALGMERDMTDMDMVREVDRTWTLKRKR